LLVLSVVDCLGHFPWLGTGKWRSAQGFSHASAYSNPSPQTNWACERNCSQLIPRHPHFLVPAFGTSSSLGNKFSPSFDQVPNFNLKWQCMLYRPRVLGFSPRFRLFSPHSLACPLQSLFQQLSTSTFLHFSQNSGNQYFAPYLKRNRVTRGSVCGNWQGRPYRTTRLSTDAPHVEGSNAKTFFVRTAWNQSRLCGGKKERSRTWGRK
jgi:hypothetical protein